jgi:N-acetylmuramoyl-L-alanine amidase
MMAHGQVDRVVSESSRLLKLSCGMWISPNSVTLSTQTTAPENPLRNGVYRVGTNYDIIAWQSDVFAAAYAEFDGKVLTVHFGLHTEVPPLTLPDDLSATIFEDIRSGKNGNTPFYAFTIKDSVKFEGHYIDYENSEFRLHLKKRKALADGHRPLDGITIVLDPGHGGEEYGAVGPMGRALPEKELNLINSRKLAERLVALGANVHMSRDADADVTLQEIVNLNWRIKPDLFISLHVNSVAETTDATNIQGFTVWHRNPGSAAFSQTVLDTMYRVNLATNRNRKVNQANFFVCRPQWVPSVLLEAGFIVNLGDFIWLIDPVQQDRMADATVDAILEYFAK